MKKIILFFFIGLFILGTACESMIEETVYDKNAEKGQFDSTRWDKAVWAE